MPRCRGCAFVFLAPREKERRGFCDRRLISNELLIRAIQPGIAMRYTRSPLIDALLPLLVSSTTLFETGEVTAWLELNLSGKIELKRAASRSVG